MKKYSDLPIPRRRKYPLDELRVGECFEFERESDEARRFGVSTENFKSRGTIHVAKRLRSVASAYMQRHPDTHFVVRTDTEANKVRIWRDR